MRRRLLVLASLALAVLLAGAALAHVRLINPSNGNKLFWSSPASIGIVINSAGSDDITDGSHATALRNAIAAWNADTGTNATLVENVSAVQQARTDWAANDIHLILFDESDTSGYFPNGSATVAITPVYFFSSGRIDDADVLFDGSEFSFTTSGQGGFFDVQDVATHELGHLLGLDHSGWAGASMYPYVSPSGLAQRSLALDDVRGLRDVSPAQSFGRITGTVKRSSDSSLVRGANVFARETASGRTTAGALSNASGVFSLNGLEAGTYTLVAAPLDFPVSSANLSSGHTIEIDFQSTVGADVAVTAGNTTASGDFFVQPDTTLSLGRAIDELPLAAVSGTTNSLALHGTGLAVGSTLTASDPTLTVTPLVWSGNQVTFDVVVPAGTAIGHVDLQATNGIGEFSILPAGLEIVPPDPIVTNVVPALGSDLGGTPLTLTGSNFHAGARVVIGSRIYVDGAVGGCTVASSSSITLTTAATSVGTYDVVVIDPSGVEGRDVNGFQFSSIPTLTSVFPIAGSSLGGTSIVLRGQNFLPGLAVRIDGVTQSSVVVDDATRAVVVSEVGVPGGPYVLEVENLGGQTATSAFSYAAQPDPVLASMSPASGPTGGGNVVTLLGANFTPDATVVFGADADTGQGGVAASALTFVDAMHLDVTVPAHAKGMVNVLLLDGLTGQSRVMPAGYTFKSGGGGGGGGCSTAPFQDPTDVRGALSGAAWMLAAFAALALSAARSRRKAERLGVSR